MKRSGRGPSRRPARHQAPPIIALAMIVVAACGNRPGPGAIAQEPTPPPTRAISRLPRAILPDRTAITLDLAVTPEEIGQGLMFRPTLPADRGMLFVFDVERVPSFWMKNTMIPLDLLFLDGRGAIVEIIENAQPCKVEPCPQYIPDVAVWAVLEVPAGTVENHRLAVGDRLGFQRVEGFPRPR